MKYKFILAMGIIFLSGCAVPSPKKSSPIPVTTLAPNINSSTTEEMDTRVFSYDYFEDTQNKFFFLYPKGWSYKKSGNEIKFFSSEPKSTDNENSYDLLITFYKNTTSTPSFLKEKIISIENPHAHFEEKNTLYDYFKNQTGESILFEYFNNDNRTQIEEGIVYFSFEDQGLRYEEPTHLFSLTYPPLWKLENSKNTEYRSYFKIFPNVFLSAAEERTLPMEYTSGNLEVGVVQETFDSLKKKIENMERLPTGQSLTVVSDVKNITLNGITGKKATHATSFGISVQFYYFPLSEKSGIFIHTYERTDGKEKIIEKIISSLQIYSSQISLENFSKKYGFTLAIPSTWKITESSPVMIGFEDVSGVHTAVIENPLEENTPHISIRFEPLEKAPTNRNTLSDTIVVPIKTQDEIKKSAQEIKTNPKSKIIDGIPVLTYFGSDPLSGNISINAEFFYKNNLVNINWGLYEKMSEIPGSVAKEKIVRDKISEIERGGGTNESKQQIKKFEEIINSFKFQ